MKTPPITTLAILLISSAFLAMAQDKGGAKGGPVPPALALTTPAFADGSEIPPQYTQSVASPVSPRLEWTNVPANTVVFVLHVHDPEAALQKTTNDFLHWIVLNIPGTARELSEGIPPVATLPDGVTQLRNGANLVGYLGPGARAPGPHHHYTFELYALDAKIDLPLDATRADVLKAMDGHVLGKAVLVGRYHR